METLSEASLVPKKYLLVTDLSEHTVRSYTDHGRVFIKKPGYLLSAMHSHAFRWFSASPLVFLLLGLLPLQLSQF
jgi:hypothetical protein